MNDTFEKNIKSFLNIDEVDFVIFDEVDSTNNILRNLAEKGVKEKTVVISNSQTSGKGRIGRSFYSPSNSGIYMSVCLRPDIELADSVFVTTSAAVAVSRAIDKLYDLKSEIKWVNDIYIGGKKVCGILTEGTTFAGTTKPKYIILGIGINLFVSEEGFPKDISSIAGAILNKKSGIDFEKGKLIANILNEFFGIYPLIQREDVYNEYCKKMFLINKKVNVSGIQNCEGIVLGVNRDYSLSVKIGEEIFSLNSGEVSAKLI